MSAGLAQVMVGVTGRTLIVTVAVTALSLAVAAVLAVRVWPDPACRTVPAGGEYTSATLAGSGAEILASSCVAPSTVP